MRKRAGRAWSPLWTNSIMTQSCPSSPAPALNPGTAEPRPQIHQLSSTSCQPASGIQERSWGHCSAFPPHLSTRGRCHRRPCDLLGVVDETVIKWEKEKKGLPLYSCKFLKIFFHFHKFLFPVAIKATVARSMAATISTRQLQRDLRTFLCVL